MAMVSTVYSESTESTMESAAKCSIHQKPLKLEIIGLDKSTGQKGLTKIAMSGLVYVLKCARQALN